MNKVEKVIVVVFANIIPLAFIALAWHMSSIGAKGYGWVLLMALITVNGINELFHEKTDKQ